MRSSLLNNVEERVLTVGAVAYVVPDGADGGVTIGDEEVGVAPALAAV